MCSRVQFGPPLRTSDGGGDCVQDRLDRPAPAVGVPVFKQLTSRPCASTSKIAGQAAGYLLPCHSRRPASRGDMCVLTSDVSSHRFPADGLMPRRVHSRMIDPTVSPPSTRSAASRSASASSGLTSSRRMTRLRLTVSSGLAKWRQP